MRLTSTVLTVFMAAACLAGCATTSVRGTAKTAQPTGFLNKTMNVDGVERRYVVYVPREYDPGRKWPLIVFLHGMGERGDDGLIPSEVGIGTAIRRHVDRFPCIVVMPQCPGDRDWTEAFDHIDTVIAETLQAYSIDRSRIMLTGLSMGGFGTWDYGAQHAEFFAALMPICGGGNVADAPALATVPIWAFHGGSDSVVSPKESQTMVEAVKKAGGDIRFTEYPGVDHNSWDRAYGDAEATKWLLSHTNERNR